MGNLQNPRKYPDTTNILLLLLSSSFFFLAGSSSPLFNPPDNYLLDCGSSSASTLSDHRVFLPDEDSLLSSGHKISLADPNPASSSPLYRTARIFTEPASYKFHIKNKGTHHLLRLHFHPFHSHAYNLSSSHFHVTASGFVLLTNFGVSAPLLKEYILWVDSEELVISFLPANGSSIAFVNAIEVFSAPGDLIQDSARLVLPTRVENLDGLSKQSLETLYRINVGGPKITPFNDTLWRTWVPDSCFLKSTTVSRTLSYGIRIQYQEYGASREIAPDSVYRSARVTDGVNVSASDSNMTWVFNVNSGFGYLIRMHFCDIASLALNELFFNIYINGNIAYEDFDLSLATGQVLSSPYYVDLVADPDSFGVFTVTIARSRLSRPSRIDGLLNGLEIMKINNSVGSFDGKLSVNSIRVSSRKGVFGTFVSSLMCGFAFMSLLVIVYMLVLRLRTEWKKSIGWSPLPVDVSENKMRSGNPVASAIVYMLVLRLRTEWKKSIGWSPLPLDVSESKMRSGNPVASGKSGYM